MNREERVEEIAELCAEHNCSEKIRKIHFDQYVDRKWHPHPSKDFEEWWQTTPEFKQHGVKTKVAWNCQGYRDEFVEVKQMIGIT